MISFLKIKKITWYAVALATFFMFFGVHVVQAQTAADTPVPDDVGSCYCPGEEVVCDSKGKCTTEQLGPPDDCIQHDFTQTNFLSFIRNQNQCTNIFKNPPSTTAGIISDQSATKYYSCTYSPSYLEGCNELRAQAATLNPTEEKKRVFQITKPVLNILIPDLKFSDVQPKPDARGIIQIPWIGEYIAAVYSLAVSVASIVAVILLIREGVLIILSGGGEEKVQGYRNIGRIAAGLMLAWGSYVILYNINASLVSFRPLEIKAVPEDFNFGAEYDELSVADAQADNEAVKKYLTPATQVSGAVPTVENPWWSSSRKSTQFTCNEYDQNPAKFPESGVVPKDYLSTYDCDGQLKGLSGRRTTVTTIAPMKDALCAAVALAAQDSGYEIRVASSWRSFDAQVSGWCPTSDDKKESNKAARQSHAVPGWSKHGKGQAIDAVLYKDGKQVTSFGINKQCDDDTQMIAKMANFFYTASPNFYRLKIENWHFEYRDSSGSNTDRTTGLASGC